MSVLFPASPANIVWRLIRARVETDGVVHTRHQRGGDKWSATITMPPLQGDDFRAFRIAAREASRLGEVWAVPDHSYSPKYTGSNGAVDGAGQTGDTINLKGLTPNSTLYAGDRVWLTGTGQVFEVDEDAAIDGSGNAVVNADPPVRVAPANDSVVVIDEPLFAMTAEGMSYVVTAPVTAGFSTTVEEWIGKKADYP